MLTLIFALSFSSTANADDYQAGYSRSRTCTKTEYREEYFPGTQESPGYVNHWTETTEVPCKTKRSAKRTGSVLKEEDTNDCKEGSLIGGLLGAGITMSGTRGKDRWWAVPAGGAAGAMIGCSIDGG
ncbi:putative cAMP phosphodiesterases class-II precursor [Prochlorococcus sp. SS52]|nr:putative cAMP phosphodiesterases class-II precursor [Prochlorococcus marinus str. LG]KGG35276.1 putative cAMP phosphodiesterases class-II precursor [Prochlorococcus sp. SS52]